MTQGRYDTRASYTEVDPWLGVGRLASRKIRGPSTSLGMTQFARNDTRVQATEKKNLGAKGRPRHFAISTFHFFIGCRACPERSRRRSPLPKEVRNPRWVPRLTK